MGNINKAYFRLYLFLFVYMKQGLWLFFSYAWFNDRPKIKPTLGSSGVETTIAMIPNTAGPCFLVLVARSSCCYATRVSLNMVLSTG
jgi:hypothetical protein